MDSSDMIGTQTILFIDEEIEYFRSFFFQLLSAMQRESKRMK